MSSEEVILWVAVATLIVAVISVIVTILYGEIERRLVRRQLRLAQEQAALRPDLSLSAAYSRIGKTVRHADGVLEFSIANTGQSTANNVRCSLQLKEPHLVLFLDGGPRTTSYLMRAAKITPVEPYRRSLNVRVRAQGRGKVRYRCWCDEAPPTEGDIEFEISEVPTPWWEEEPAPDFAIDKTWHGPLRVGEPASFHITATNRGGEAIDLHLWDELIPTMQYVSHTGPSPLSRFD